VTERDPKQGWLAVGGWIGAFLVFMGFYAGLQNTLRVADQNYSVTGISHNEDRIKELEKTVSVLRNHVDQQDSEIRRDMMTKNEHEIYDKDRIARWQDNESRLLWLEHQCGKK